MKVSIVVGLQFGDEGKGLMTSLLTSKNPLASLVIRYNGGHQAGHTVVKDNKRHVFTNFGSGTINGSDTYWSRFCTVDPVGILREKAKLDTLDLEYKPTLYIDPLCPIVTPYDKIANKNNRFNVDHGTCGVGFGTTVDRHEKHYRLYAQDLLYPDVMKLKLAAIRRYYGVSDDAIQSNMMINEQVFLHHVQQALLCVVIGKPVFKSYSNIVFEGAQGIMLDQDFGFFPHVTRSNTTTKNAWQLINELSLPYADVFYMSRIYQTRHGNGPMTTEKYKDKLVLKNNESETNVYNPNQGAFRVAPLDLSLIRYALSCDIHFSKQKPNRNIVFTCLDQVDSSSIVYCDNGNLEMNDICTLAKSIGMQSHNIFKIADPEGKTFTNIIGYKINVIGKETTFV